MNLIWPKFHDPDYRPGMLAMLRIHWVANLAMLRSPRDVGVFMLISFVPVAVLLLGLAFFPLSLDPTPGTSGSIVILLALGVLVFYLVQHVAFMIAIELTYTPHVRWAIRGCGTPICQQCGQLLHGDDAPCPECGGGSPDASRS
ncbi:MAG: hypothetical protein VX641_03215 [Planctomycetota bacterium]|nr:hypothetical protein [Planctomycetota bacterium]